MNSLYVNLGLLVLVYTFNEGELCYTKRDPRTKSIITLELVRDAEFQPLPDLLIQNLHFTKVPC